MAFNFLGEYVGTSYNPLGNQVNNIYKYHVKVWSEQDIVTNTSKIKIQQFVTKIGHGTASTWYWRVLGEQNYYHYAYANLYTDTVISPPEIIRTINHNTDGTKSFTFQARVENELTVGANANLNNNTMKRGELSVNITLPTIPRASDFNVVGHMIGQRVDVNINPVNSAFRHDVIYRLGSVTSTVGSKVAINANFIPSRNDAGQIVNSVKGSMSIEVRTFSGSTQIGSKTKNFDLYVADDMFPTISQISAAGINLMADRLYISGKSQAKLSVLSAAGSYGSVISKYNIDGHGINIAAQEGVTNTLISSGTQTHNYVFTVTDSRGRAAVKNHNITVHTYEKPRIEYFNVFRCNDEGVQTDDGQFVTLSFKAVIQNTGGANVNTKSYRIDYRVKDGVWVEDWKSGALTDYTQEVTIEKTPNWDVTKSYEIRCTIYDYYSNDVTAVSEIGTASCAFNIEDGGLGVGKYWEKGALDVAGSIVARSFIMSDYGNPLEIGKYIDLHNPGSISDYDARLYIDDNKKIYYTAPGITAGELYHSGNIGNISYDHVGDTIAKRDSAGDIKARLFRSNYQNEARLEGAICFRVNSSTDTYMRWCSSSAAVKAWLGSASLLSKNGHWGLAAPDNVDTSWIRTPTPGIIPYKIGVNSNLGTQEWMFAESHANHWYSSGGSRMYGNANDFFINRSLLPETNGTKVLGYSTHRWSAIYASNGVIQTSDMRYKSDIKNIDDEIFFNMIKGTGVHSYVLNPERVDLDEPTIMPLTLEEAPQENIQVGILAQELAQFEGSEYILNYDEDAGYSVNNYNLTSAVMACLKVEISKRELLQDRVNELEERLNKFESLLVQTLPLS